MEQVKFRENAVTACVRTAEQITIHVRAGEGEPPLAPIVVRFAQLSDAVRAEAMGYGLEVRLTRAAALERDSKSGRSATPQDKHAAIRALAEHYASGSESWNMAAGVRGPSQEVRDLASALEAALGLGAETALEQVRAMSGAERDALRLDEEIKPHLESVLRARVGTQSGGAKALIAKLKGI